MTLRPNIPWKAQLKRLWFETFMLSHEGVTFFNVEPAFCELDNSIVSRFWDLPFRINTSKISKITQKVVLLHLEGSCEDVNMIDLFSFAGLKDDNLLNLICV